MHGEIARRQAARRCLPICLRRSGQRHLQHRAIECGERAGIIKGWGARVDPKSVERGVLAFMFLLIDRPDQKRLVDAICALPQVLECHHVTGDWSYLIKLRLSEVSEIETVLADTIKQNPGAIRTHTVLALSTRKDTPAILGLST